MSQATPARRTSRQPETRGISTCGADGACDPYSDGTWHNAEDVFYSKIDPSKTGAAGLIYSTFLGGAYRDFGEAIAIDKNGRAWITGRTASSDFPRVSATQGTFGGNYDAFVAQIDPALSGAASLCFSSFLGGALYDEATGLKVDPLGDIHVVGYTASTNFPVTGALQPQTEGGNEGFIVKIVSPALVSMTLKPDTVIGGAKSTGKVKLSAAAPAGGIVVTLASSDLNTATVPASVTVAAGNTTATFAITTKAVTAGDGRDDHRHLQRRGQDGKPDGESAGRTGRRERESRHGDGRSGEHRHGDARHGGPGGRRGRDAGEQRHQCGDGTGVGERWLPALRRRPSRSPRRR